MSLGETHGSTSMEGYLALFVRRGDYFPFEINWLSCCGRGRFWTSPQRRRNTGAVGSSGGRWSLSSAVMLTSTRSYVQYGGVTAGCLWWASYGLPSAITRRSAAASVFLDRAPSLCSRHNRNWRCRRRVLGWRPCNEAQCQHREQWF